MSFRDLLEIMGRRWFILLIHLLLGAAAGFLLAYFSPPQFEAQTQMTIEARTQTSPGFIADGPLREIINQRSSLDIQTETQTLNSQVLYYDTLSRLGRPFPAGIKDFEDNFPQIRAEQIATSQAVLITVTGSNREFVQEMAETLPLVYKDTLDRRDRETLQAALSRLEENIKTQDTRVKELTVKIAKIRRDNQIVNANEEASLRAAQEQSIENSLAEAEAAAAGAREARRLAQDQLKA
ncbi:MAG: Wzz/FepE/Etk N-terminal domain-containing protein, partial [Fimbriimonadaceae bacterium]|nr:Wzz/FepE/Etk N-terminal domain-containing protein [Fimbriimonadaceae bacterium]